MSTIRAPAASFCTDATPLIAAALFSYAWLEATIWPLVETSEKRNFPVGPFLITNFPGTSASRSEGVCGFRGPWSQADRRALAERGASAGLASSYTGQAMDMTPAEFLIAIAIAAGISMLTFRHADKHGSTHATAWGIGAFLAAGVVVPGLLRPVLAAQAATDRVATCLRSNGNDEPEWLRPIDLMVDSYAPEQIAFELGRRHALYLREAQRLVADGLTPDANGLADRGARRDEPLPGLAAMARSRGAGRRWPPSRTRPSLP